MDVRAARRAKGTLARRSASLCDLRSALLEEKDDQQNDQDQNQNTTTDVHLQPPFSTELEGPSTHSGANQHGMKIDKGEDRVQGGGPLGPRRR